MAHTPLVASCGEIKAYEAGVENNKAERQYICFNQANTGRKYGIFELLRRRIDVEERFLCSFVAHF